MGLLSAQLPPPKYAFQKTWPGYTATIFVSIFLKRRILAINDLATRVLENKGLRYQTIETAGLNEPVDGGRLHGDKHDFTL